MNEILLDGKPVVVGSVLYVVNCKDSFEVKEIDHTSANSIRTYRKSGAFYRFTEGGELQSGMGRVLYWAPVFIDPPKPPVKKYQWIMLCTSGQGWITPEKFNTAEEAHEKYRIPAIEPYIPKEER